MDEHENNAGVADNNDGGKGASACAVNNETPGAPESYAAPAEPSFAVSEAEWTNLKASLDKRYAEIATLLRYNKTKDESIQRLSSEVQKYRDGFAFSALKPFINQLIAFREDCKKSVRDAEKSPPDDEKAKKFTEILISDFEDILGNIGLDRREGGCINLNGKPLSSESTEPRALPEEPPLSGERKEDESSQTPICAGQIKSIPELIESLNNGEIFIRSALKDRAVIDKTIQDCIALAARTDDVHYFALVGPVSRQLYALLDRISGKKEPIGDSSGGAPIELYKEILQTVVTEIGNILEQAGVKIETVAASDDVFDTKKHKLLKTVPTDDEKRDRSVANVYTDCYIYDEKVVSPSKVDVYKFQQ